VIWTGHPTYIHFHFWDGCEICLLYDLVIVSAVSALLCPRRMTRQTLSRFALAVLKGCPLQCILLMCLRNEHS